VDIAAVDKGALLDIIFGGRGMRLRLRRNKVGVSGHGTSASG